MDRANSSACRSDLTRATATLPIQNQPLDAVEMWSCFSCKGGETIKIDTLQRDGAPGAKAGNPELKL
jgi:hypothetical protein